MEHFGKDYTELQEFIASAKHKASVIYLNRKDDKTFNIGTAYSKKPIKESIDDIWHLCNWSCWKRGSLSSLETWEEFKDMDYWMSDDETTLLLVNHDANPGFVSSDIAIVDIDKEETVFHVALSSGWTTAYTLAEAMMMNPFSGEIEQH